MYCTNCGTQMKDGARFCPECGAAQGQAAGAVQQAAPIQNSTVAPVASTCPQPPQGQQQYAAQPGYGQQPSCQQPTADGPWYGKTWVIVLFLIFLWPVGVVFMWMKTCTWQTYAKVIISVVLGVGLLMSIGSWIMIFTSLSSMYYF